MYAPTIAPPWRTEIWRLFFDGFSLSRDLTLAAIIFVLLYID